MSKSKMTAWIKGREKKKKTHNIIITIINFFFFFDSFLFLFNPFHSYLPQNPPLLFHCEPIFTLNSWNDFVNLPNNPQLENDTIDHNNKQTLATSFILLSQNPIFLFSLNQLS